MRFFLIYFCFSAALLVAWISAAQITRRYPIDDQKAIAGIVGEYAKNDIYGMKLIAHAIRNRGTLKGVCGVYAGHNKLESSYIWKLARVAWYESAFEPDTTQGADSWYSIEDWVLHGTPKNTKFLFRYENTMFFKSTNKNRR